MDLGNGLIARAQTFNGTVPGPAFNLKLGDRVIVHFTNLLPEPSSIHWHGIELDNESDGTGITQTRCLQGRRSYTGSSSPGRGYSSITRTSHHESLVQGVLRLDHRGGARRADADRAEGAPGPGTHHDVGSG